MYLISIYFLSIFSKETISLVPKKMNWDLKRDLAPKLAKLERHTHRAIYEEIRMSTEHRYPSFTTGRKIQQQEAAMEEDGAEAQPKTITQDDTKSDMVLQLCPQKCLAKTLLKLSTLWKYPHKHGDFPTLQFYSYRLFFCTKYVYCAYHKNCIHGTIKFKSASCGQAQGPVDG